MFMVLVFFLLMGDTVQAQLGGGTLGGLPNRMSGMGSRGGGSRGGSSDSISFEKRKFSDDSVDIRFRYLDTARYYTMDSSINDFYKRIPLKQELIQIGHNGNATRPILFSPLRSGGWDAGFHALDPYAFTVADTRFMNTNKPFTEMGYLVGSKAEQQISLLHSQNATPDWNFVFHFRLVNAPGGFNSQNTNHNNVRFNSDFTSKNRRYHAYLVLMSNALQSSENGGIVSDSFLVNNNPAFEDRFNIPTNLASTAFASRNFFNVKLVTGNRYTERNLLFRQQYDFGKKDSIVTDSTVIKTFLPRLRLEHTVQSIANNYRFFDAQAQGSAAFYKNQYGLLNVLDTVDFNQGVSTFKNDFSVIQFPDAKNPLQFFKAGATLFNFRTSPDSLRDVFSNVMVHGEYRNRTRNRKWDMLLYGEFYAAGRDAGNYTLQAKLQRSLGPKVGQLELGFHNINRSPSYLYDRQTAFPVQRTINLNDENVTSVYGSLYLNPIKARVSVNYYLLSNYTYFSDPLTVSQYAPLFNFVRAGINKEVTWRRHWKLYLDLYVQAAAGNAPIHLPWLYTRTRIGYEGRPYRNLVMATGFDMRFTSAYFADGYSPIVGQFYYQDQQKIATLPDIAYYIHFRIRSFTAFTRFENLNTMTTRYGFGFKNNNLAAPLYATPGLVFRLGIFWNFVN